MHAMTLKKSKHDEHNTVGIPTIYLIEEFDKLEYEGPTVGPAKTIRDKILRMAAVCVGETTKNAEIFTESCNFLLAKVVIS